MNIEQLVKALSTYFKEDEDIVRQIVVDNVDLDDMGLDDDIEETGAQAFPPIDWSWSEFEVNYEPEEGDLTDEELREEVERIRNNPDWMSDEDAVKQMEGLAREVFDGLSTEEQTRTLLDMVLNLCDEIDKLKNEINELKGTK